MSSTNQRRKSKKSNKSRPIIGRFTILTCIAIVAVFAIILLVNYTQRLNSFNAVLAQFNIEKQKSNRMLTETIFSGVKIDGVDVGGLTIGEAKQKVQNAIAEKLQEPYILITYGSKHWEYDYSRFNITTDLDSTLEKAWNIGRKGTDAERLAEIEKVKIEGINFPITIKANPDFIKDELVKIKEEVDRKPVSATVSVKFDSTHKPNFTYTKEAVGYSLDVDAAYNEILAAFSSNQQLEYELKPQQIQPAVKLSDIQKDYVRVSSFSTYVSPSDKKRKQNILVSLAEFDGIVIMPGESLSFNQTTGERTKEKGYEVSIFINSDQVYDESVGGGVCQSSTTIFNAALLAGATMRGNGGTMEIIRRYPHSWPSTYVPKGQDASVNWPHADLVMRNARNTPFFIHTYFNNNRIYCEFWGEALPNNVKYTIVSEIVEEQPAPEVVRVEDKTGKYVTRPGTEKKVSDSRPGYIINTYRIEKIPGQEQEVKTFLFKSVYNPIPGKIYYKPAAN